MSIRIFGAAVAVLLSCAQALWAGPLQDDLKARRARVMERLTPQSLAIVWSAPTRVYSGDVDYEYRQDSNLLYLAGVTQPDTILVLMPGNKTQREILFVSEPNPRREHWNGHILTKAEATAESGIANVYYTGQFESFLTAMFGQSSFGSPRLAETQEYATFFAAVAAGKASLALPLGAPPPPSAPLTQPFQFANQARERFFNVGVTDTIGILSDLRQVKTPYELQVMEQSGLISSDAHKAGMRTARPGRFEYEVEAAIEHTYLSRGAMSWGYPSIVGSGPNATTLHYNASSRKMEDGDLLLVDAAGNFQGYTVDITRTYPVNGRYSAPQRALYEIVLEAQLAAIDQVRPGRSFMAAHDAAVRAVTRGLIKVGILKGPLESDLREGRYKPYFMHKTGHWLGLDVHDVGDYRIDGESRLLEAGMVFTIEPGLYVAPDDKTVPAKWRGIGIRTEDDIVITADGHRILTDALVRDADEIEAFMAG